ncbi:MAG: CusA/CzcA family heavy metal efflux RND transporter [Epsilonproteobacteria bacterium]|nr:CusA/CzcA family heavy metal efflux RND transporter [Campylobacterota bacterium]NPA63707.1 efflux RND transporter permease subunit [Campylobacterota bacterium]
MWIYRFFIKHRYFVAAFFVVLALLGLQAYRQIPIDAFPDITPKQVVIYVESPGNDAEAIEKFVTYPIESAMAGLVGVKRIVSSSLYGLGYVSVFFDEDYDIYFLRQLVAQRLKNVDIPEQFGKPVMGPNTTGLGQVFWYRLRGPHSLEDLKLIQEYIVKPMLKSVPGVEEVTSWGGYDKSIQITLDPNKMRSLSITLQEVEEAITQANSVGGGGYFEFNKEAYILRTDGLYKSLEDIEKTVIRSAGARSITIKDIAKVDYSKKPRFGAVTLNGEETVFGMVLQRTGTNAAKVVEEIQKRLPQISQALPKDVQIEPLYDRSSIIQKAVAMMQEALLWGILLVVAVLFLFLWEVRTSLIVVLSLPLSLLIAFLVMQRLGLSANLMSLGGLAIAIGMVVDATIVVVENAYRHLGQGGDRATLIARSTWEVTRPVIFAILIIAATFAPLLFLGGLAGKLYSPMAKNILIVMFASVLVALVLVPVVSYWFLRPRAESEVVERLKRVYKPLLEWVLAHPRVVVAGSFVIFGILAFLVAKQGKEFMPKLEEESIMYRVVAIPGTALGQSVELSRQIEEYLLERYPQVQKVLAMIGRSEKGETAGSNYMELLVLLDQEADLAKLRHRMSEDLRHHFAYVQFIPTQPIASRIEELLEGVRAELAVKIYGQDQKRLQSLADEVAQVLARIAGVDHLEVESQLGQPQIVVVPDYTKLALYGLKASDLARSVRLLFAKSAVAEYFDGIKRLHITLGVEGYEDLERLGKLPLISVDGSVVRLEDVAKIIFKQGPAVIKRENMNRFVAVSLDLEGIDTHSFVQKANEALQRIDFGMGYYYSWAGDFKNMTQTMAQMSWIVPLALGIVFLLLLSAFGSFGRALVVLLGVPLGLVGSFLALLAADLYINVAVIVGFIVVVAIAVLNGVVLVSFLKEDIKEAALLRLRPVLMTASTTFFGIVPLLFAQGVGRQIEYPLAVVVAGGILTSTFVTLVVLPALLAIIEPKKESNDTQMSQMR